MDLSHLEWLELQSRKKYSDTRIIFDEITKPTVTKNVQTILPARAARVVNKISETTGTERALAALDSLPSIPFPVRKLTPAGRLWETAKSLAGVLVITDPLDIIED